MTASEEKCYYEACYERAPTPFGLNRCVIVMAYLFVIISTGMAAGAADPLQQMLQISGAFAEIEDPQARSAALASLVGFGVSSLVLSGLLAGPLCQYLGCKLSGVFGVGFHCLAYILFFIVPTPRLYYVASFSFGLSFQLILNAHISTSVLFPNNVSLVISLLACAPDVSLFIPPMLLSFISKGGNDAETVRRYVLIYLLGACLPAFLIDLLLLPWRPYECPDVVRIPDVLRDLEKQPLFSENEHVETAIESVVETDAETDAVIGNMGEKSDKASNSLDYPDRNTMNEVVAAQNKVVKPYDEMTLREQLCTWEFWLFVPFFVLLFARKKHFGVLIRSIFAEMDVANGLAPGTSVHLTNIYNSVVPYGFIIGIAWGAFIDVVGPIWLMVLLNTVGCVASALCLIFNMPLQYLTLLFFVCFQAFCMGLMLSFCAAIYGFQNLAPLQGILCAAAGGFAVLMDLYWPNLILQILHSFWRSNLIALVIGIISFLPPLLIARTRALHERKLRQAQEPHLVVGGTARSILIHRRTLVQSVRKSLGSRK